MRLRLLVSVAALAATLLPAAAHAATLASSSQYATPVQLTWDVTATTAETLYRAPGPCTALPMLGALSIDASAGTPLDAAFSDAPGDGVFCYYLQDDLVGAYSNGLDVTVDTVAPTGSITSPALVHSATGAVTADAIDATSGVHSVAFERSSDNGATWDPMSTDLTAPYAADWDTIDGTYLVHAVVTDEALHVFTTPSATLTVDTTPPTVSMTAPAASSTVWGSTVNVSATADDGAGSGVSSVAFEAQLGAGPGWTSLGSGTPAGGGVYNLTWDTTGLNGTYKVRAIATDAATLTTTSAAVTSVLVDNTAPTVSVTAPAASSTLHGASANVTASASDGAGSGVSSVAFEYQAVGAGSWTPIGTDNSAPFSFSWTLPSDGLYNLRATATDGATHSTTSSVVGSILVDNTPPSVSVTAPAASAIVHGSAVAVSATATDGSGAGVTGVAFEVQLGAGPSWVSIGSGTSAGGGEYDVTWNTTGLNGSYKVRAIATDGATLTTTSAAVTSVLVDNTAPAAPSTPTGLTSVSASPTITFPAATDTLAGGVRSGIDHYDVFRDGTPVHTIVDTGAASYTWADSGAPATTPPSTYSYTVKAVDKAGNTSATSGTLAILLDASGASAPTSVAAQSSPTSLRPQLSWVAPAAPGFTVAHYKIYRGGVFLLDVTGTTVFTDNSIGLADGSYTYQIVAASSGDVTLGIASAPVTVVYDTTAPTAPTGTTAGAALDGSITIGWGASSDGTGSGVVRYSVRRALSSVAPATIADGDAVCQGLVTSCSDTTALNGKAYSYAVFAVDGAGNVSAAGTALSVTARDQLAPAAPTGFAAVPGDTTVALSWAGPGDDVAGYVLVAKPGTAAPASETDGTRVCSTIVATSTSCTATGLTNGATYTFGLFALDEALNRSAPATVTAVPDGPVTDATPPAAVKALDAKVSGHTVTLTWKNPADKDFDHVVIMASERKPSAHAAATRVYSGKGTRATTTLAAGQSRWFSVVAYDRVGNASAPASVHAAVAAASPFGPAPNAKVHGSVRLSWPVAKGAKYYNVQLYAGKKRIFVGWPAGRALQLPKAKLKRGTRYTWYVWPGLGAKSKAQYGKLIGKNVFTYAG